MTVNSPDNVLVFCVYVTVDGSCICLTLEPVSVVFQFWFFQVTNDISFSLYICITLYSKKWLITWFLHLLQKLLRSTTFYLTTYWLPVWRERYIFLFFFFFFHRRCDKVCLLIVDITSCRFRVKVQNIYFREPLRANENKM